MNFQKTMIGRICTSRFSINIVHFFLVFLEEFSSNVIVVFNNFSQIQLTANVCNCINIVSIDTALLKAAKQSRSWSWCTGRMVESKFHAEQLNLENKDDLWYHSRHLAASTLELQRRELLQRTHRHENWRKRMKVSPFTCLGHPEVRWSVLVLQTKMFKSVLYIT